MQWGVRDRKGCSKHGTPHTCAAPASRATRAGSLAHPQAAAAGGGIVKDVW